MAMPTFAFFSVEEADTIVGNAAPYLSSTEFTDANVSELNSANRMQGSTEHSCEFDISAQSYTTVYISVNLFSNGTSSPERPLLLIKSDAGDYLRINPVNSSETMDVDIYNGATWDNLGQLVSPFDLDPAVKMDIFIVLHNTTGRIRIKCDQITSAVDFTGDTIRNADTTIDAVKIANAQDSATYFTEWQALFINGTDTLETLRIAEETTSTIGNLNNVTSGAESDVDQDWGQTFASSLGLYMVADEDAEGAGFNMQAIPTVYTGYDVESVIVAVVAHDVGGALFLKDRLRISATDYDGTGVLPGQEWTLMQFRHDVDPSTASAWASIAAVEAAECGFILDTTS